MSTERLFLVDPYNKEHNDLIRDFEIRNELPASTTEYIQNIRQIPKEEYLKRKKEGNEIIEILYLEQGGVIKDCCTIDGEKDIRSCKITFPVLKNRIRNRSLVTTATDYAQNSLGMIEVFTVLPPQNLNMSTQLESQGYEDLGENNGMTIYLNENKKTKENSIKQRAA